jgi:hypothetical protein
MFSFVWIAGIIFGISVFLLPTIVAVVGRRRNASAILILNLLGGWTIIGWVAALVWAVVAQLITVPSSSSLNEPHRWQN